MVPSNLSCKDLHKQTMIVSIKGDTFSARFLNIFVDYSLGQLKVGDKLWTNWIKASLKLWQTQLNFTKQHPMVRAVYQFHMYYHVRRILKRLQISLPHEASFNAADNLYSKEKLFEICEDYEVPNDPGV